MKKVYSKPEIVFESFTMNSNIAACAEKTDSPAKGSCGIVYTPTITVFVSESTGCNFWDETPEEHDGICYHNPSEDTRLFGS